MNKGRISLILFLLMFLHQMNSVSGYTYTGTINENGDQYWNSNEISFRKFEIFAHEEISLDFSSTGNLEVMLCICSDVDDIETIMQSLIDYGESSRLFLWIDSYSITYGSYEPTIDRSLHIAIFSYSTLNPPSMSYTLNSNLPSGTRFYDESDSDSDGGINPFLILLVIIIAIVIYQDRKKKKRQAEMRSGNNTTASYPQQGYQNQYTSLNYQNFDYADNEPSSQAKANQGIENKFCPNCGKSNHGVFCTDCGTKM